MNSELSFVILTTLLLIILGLVLWFIAGYIVYKKWRQPKKKWIIGMLILALVVFLSQKKKTLTGFLNTMVQFVGAIITLIKMGEWFAERWPKTKIVPKGEEILEGQIEDKPSGS